jgi:hypothetical protein
MTNLIVLLDKLLMMEEALRWLRPYKTWPLTYTGKKQPNIWLTSSTETKLGFVVHVAEIHLQKSIWFNF